MKPKHLDALITSCLAFAECSTCVRRKFGAVLVDPTTKSIIAEAYNGPPRGGPEGGLCGPQGAFCERDGIDEGCLSIQRERTEDFSGERLRLSVPGRDSVVLAQWGDNLDGRLSKVRAAFVEKYPPIPSGTRLERGCHHAELNSLAKAARRGVSTDGAWLIVTGEPCEMCSKLLHHAGIVKVVCIRNGYAGGDAGPEYLRAHGVEVEYVDGPADPRLE